MSETFRLHPSDCPPGYRRNEFPGDCYECGFYHDDDDEGCGLPSGYRCKGCGFKRIEQPPENLCECDCGRPWVHTDQGLLCPVCLLERVRKADAATQTPPVTTSAPPSRRRKEGRMDIKRHRLRIAGVNTHWCDYRDVAPIIAAHDRYRAALEEIADIKNQSEGCDWEEIDAARGIARRALAPKKGE